MTRCLVVPANYLGAPHLSDSLKEHLDGFEFDVRSFAGDDLECLERMVASLDPQDFLVVDLSRQPSMDLVARMMATQSAICHVIVHTLTKRCADVARSELSLSNKHSFVVSREESGGLLTKKIADHINSLLILDCHDNVEGEVA